MDGKFSGNEVFQNEGRDYQNPEEFKKLVHARRSVRKFTAEKIPDHIVNDCLDTALLAPNSSNLQTWEFYRVTSTDARAKLVEACFSQGAAASASELIVCVARRDTWRKNSKRMLAEFKKLPVDPPKVVQDYYGKLVPFVYTVGWFNILTPLKWILNTVVGIFKVVPRDPISSFGINVWAVKSCALACENLMLAFRSYGYDTCPMEGFDSWRAKKAIGLKGCAEIVMVIGAGKRAEGGVYGPRMRFPNEQFIKTV
ncbi:MAG: nitroreductase family protein [Rhizobacter sp.]|nr:nitroreductase family protein [Bacteriovorax sp.]